MLYVVSAYRKGTAELVKRREVRGWRNVEALEAIWDAQGYETDAYMNCLKYIEVTKIEQAASSPTI